MVNLIRRFQQPLLILLTIFVIISFIIFFNAPNVRNGGFTPTDRVATLYGRPISRTKLERGFRRFETIRTVMDQMSFFQYIMTLAGDNPKGGEESIVWNTFVLDHEAEALGIQPTADQVDTAIRQLQVLQTNGAFDYAKFVMLQQNVLMPRGFTGDEVGVIVGDELKLSRLKELIGSMVAASPFEVREAYTDRYQKSQVSVVRFKFDEFKAAAEAKDEDVKKLFEDRKATLTQPEKRKVKYIAFELPKQDKPLTGRERTAAMEKLLDQAHEFAHAMTAKDADFGALSTAYQAKANPPKPAPAPAPAPAKEDEAKTPKPPEEKPTAEVKTGETPAFAATDAPAELEHSSEAAAAAFHLSMAEPNSDAILAGNTGYVVLQLSAIEPSRPLTFDEAKPQLVTQLKEQQAREAMNIKASTLRTILDQVQKGGTSLEEAAKASNVTLEKLPAFSQAEPLRDPDGQAIREKATEMAEGELSEFTQTQSGGLLIYLEKKMPIDEADFEKQKANLAKQIVQQKQESLVKEWIEARRKAADLKMGT
jgi:hypothetical protein